MKHVIVIGGGVAGLMAAMKLRASSDLQVTLLEAQDRIGGRIRTVQQDGNYIELGAEFIHGNPPELLALLEDLNLETYELSGQDFNYDCSDDSLHPQDEGTHSDKDSPFNVLEQMTAWSDAHPMEDLAFDAWCERENIDPDVHSGARGYVEGFNAADASRISVRSLAIQQEAEDSIEGEALHHVKGGYHRLPKEIAARFTRLGGTLRLQSQVKSITWSRGSVDVQLHSDESLHADAAIITLPLGVLQSSSVAFSPAPADILQQANRMAMGPVVRMCLVFRNRWWAQLDHLQKKALQKLSFILPEEQRSDLNFRVFWAGYPSLDPVLTAWAGGTSTEAFAAMTDEQIAEAACHDLSRIFGVPKQQILDELVTQHRHDWSSDPLFGGAYSWVPAGAVDASEKMTHPVEDTLFFAGEHTDTTGHWGTVHGALRSGIRAAQQLLDSH
ncbi:flavin monoamine oxidase family protein [Terriglobus roseus]|uniref:Tryptophan 2-monooxygenase n=1 Tax=Terriglobus roseus TaxID=392734 RepID=A0A1G7R244_9BACT|nr:NAD(P)/FAD-dependent oxidoreductase [Terriglobus roseus]SDG04209.1 Monoamine oxidase [Terriglobus roseus]